MFVQLKLPAMFVIIILSIHTPALADSHYTTALTSGPFLISPQATSVDWVVVNNDVNPVDIRVRVYQLNLGGTKSLTLGGQVTKTLAPGETTHNANSVGSVFFLGFLYEVMVEATSKNVHPNVNQWNAFSGTGFIPATLIPSGDFVEIKRVPEKGKRCSDGIDNDGDGLVDGDDPDCRR